MQTSPFPVSDLAALEALVAERRQAGDKIVLTNGCFDLVHVGHLRSIVDARSRGDFLIVCINDDDSVRRAKGEGRPVFPALERAELLGGFAAVDAVLIFAEDTVDGILETIRPDVYAKGTDYTPENVPEGPTVRAYGGTIAIVGDPKDHSSRSVLAAIQEGTGGNASAEERGNEEASR